MNKFLKVALFSMLLVGCAGSDVTVHTISDNPPALNLPLPAQLQMLPVKWQVITQAQIQKLAKQNNPNIVIYAVDPSNFQNLALNAAEIQRYIQDQKIIILTYKQYYEGYVSTPATK
jgi:hypothetical protein